VTVVANGCDMQSARGLGGYLGAGALKKPANDTHLRARCVALVSSSGFLLTIAYAFKNFGHYV
jgi:hypothetical protein